MKTYLTRLIVIVVLAVAGSWLWSNRDRIGVLSNNNVRIRGDWHKVEMDFAEHRHLLPSPRPLSASAVMSGPRTSCSAARESRSTPSAMSIIYELSFPDDENMVWSIRKGDTDTKVVGVVDGQPACLTSFRHEGERPL